MPASKKPSRSVARSPRRGKRSPLEAGFARVLASTRPGVPPPEREHRFHPVRMWRFDFAWPAALLAVEIDGGIFIRGGHNRGVQFTDDCEKLNAAVELGWRVLRFTTLDLRQRPVQCVEQVLRLLDARPAKHQRGLLE